MQDSLASRTEDLALFILNKYDLPQMIRIQRIQISNPHARGNLMRFAAILIIPMEIPPFDINLQQISNQLQEKLQQDYDDLNLHAIKKSSQKINIFLQSIRLFLNEKYPKVHHSIEDEYLALKKLLFGKKKSEEEKK